MAESAPNYYVYIVTNRYHSVLYTSVARDLRRRVADHRKISEETFTGRQGCKKLVYYQGTEYAHEALHLEQRIKAASRLKKIQMINELNPNWRDLSLDVPAQASKRRRG